MEIFKIIFTTILTQPLTNGLILFYKILGQNMGLAILGFGALLFLISNKLTRHQMEAMKKMKLYEKELAALKAPLKFEAGQTLNTRFLYLNLTKPDAYKFDWFPTKLPGPILILAALLQFISAKITAPFVERQKKVAKKTPETTDDMQVSMQQSMVYTFPLMTIVFGLNFPSALAIYWLLFSVLQAWRQYKSAGWGGLTPFVARLGLLK